MELKPRQCPEDTVRGERGLAGSTWAHLVMILKLGNLSVHFYVYYLIWKRKKLQKYGSNEDLCVSRPNMCASYIILILSPWHSKHNWCIPPPLCSVIRGAAPTSVTAVALGWNERWSTNKHSMKVQFSIMNTRRENKLNVVHEVQVLLGKFYS